MAELTISQPERGVWVLDDGGINLYLIAGRERAVLLDSGFGMIGGLRARAEALCGLPVTLVHTHAHGDHTGGDGEWDSAFLNRAEWDAYRADHGEGVRLLPLEDGDTLDLGGRTLEVYHVPGHSPGSVALLDRAARILFSGDTVMTQPVFLFSPASSPADYRASLEKLTALSDRFDTVYPSHSRWPLPAREALSGLTACAEAALAGGADGREEFELDLVVTVARFAGYRSGGYTVATEDLGGGVPGVPS